MVQIGKIRRKVIQVIMPNNFCFYSMRLTNSYHFLSNKYVIDQTSLKLKRAQSKTHIVRFTGVKNFLKIIFIIFPKLPPRLSSKNRSYDLMYVKSTVFVQNQCSKSINRLRNITYCAIFEFKLLKQTTKKNYFD